MRFSKRYTFMGMIAVFLLFSMYAISAVIYVDGINGNDTTGDGSQAYPYKTIHKGVNVAFSGDTVIVFDGVYAGNIVISKSITLEAGSNPVIDGGGGSGIKIYASNVTVDGFEVKNCYTGILVGYEASPPGNLQNVKILNNKVHNITGGNGAFGVYVGYQSENLPGGPVYTPEIPDHLDYSGLEIRNNEIYDSTGACLVLQSIKAGTGMLVVDGNRIHNGNASAIWLDSSRDVEITSNILEKCVTGIFISGYADGYYTGEPDAPYDPQNIYVLYNTIQTNSVNGISVYDGWPSSIYIHYNNIVGSNTNEYAWGGIYRFVGGTEPIQAEYNWWGKATGPRRLDPPTGSIRVGDGDRISKNVDCDPWLLKPVDDNALYLLPNDASVYIKPDESITVDLMVANLQQYVKACQAFIGYNSSYFTSTGVTEGGGVWDDLIYEHYALGEVDAAIGVFGESYPSQGTQADGKVAIFTFAAKGIEGVTSIIFRPNLAPDPFLIGSTYLSDMDALPVWPSKINSTNIYIDGTLPLINISSAKQSGQELLISLGSTTTAIQGIVNIKVTASDPNSPGRSGLDAIPAVTITPFGGVPENATFVNESPTGTFNFTWMITPSTPNGIATINVMVSDKAGNMASDSDTFNINKNQISGIISMETMSPASYSFDRNVVFTLTNSLGIVIKTYTLSVNFTNSSAIATGSYVLTDVPSNVAGISAKTAWSLREKKSAILDINGQAIANFTGSDILRGGDLNETNSVNSLDYAILQGAWNTVNPAADVNADGLVNSFDYVIMKKYWLKIGDPQ